jgi:hypothetical protein
VLDVVVVRARLVARDPRGQRLGRLYPVNDGEHDQREADENSKPNEKTAALHDRAAYGLDVILAVINDLGNDRPAEASLAMPTRRSWRLGRRDR